MRIKIKSEDTNFRLWLPTGMLLNPLTAIVCTTVANSKEILPTKVPYSCMIKLFRAVKKSRRILRGQPLVSVHDSDGDTVEIWI